MAVVRFYETAGRKKDLEALISRVRELAEERDITVPKKIGRGGICGMFYYVCYNNRRMKDLIEEVGKERGLTPYTTYISVD